MDIVVFGAGYMGRRYWRETENTIKYYVDNDPSKHNSEINGYKVLPPSALTQIGNFDRVIVTIFSYEPIVAQLLQMGIPQYKIEVPARYPITARRLWLEDFSVLCRKMNIKGNVAEAGVHVGAFASIINRCFPDKKLYLFDTFEGFSDKDFAFENLPSATHKDFSNTSVQTVLNKMKYPENCIIKQGWFPESAEGMDDEFCFVNLDMDLYKPIYEGLCFFWDKMAKNGVILVHDFFDDDLYPNVKQAVYDFMKLHSDMRIYPNGDTLSVIVTR